MITILTVSRHLHTILKIAEFAKNVRKLDKPLQTEIRKAVLIVRTGVKKAEETTGELGDKAQGTAAAVIAVVFDVVKTITTVVASVKSAIGMLRGLFSPA